MRASTAALGVMCVGVLVTALDQTVVVTAVPAIARDLNVPFGEIDRMAWVITSFLIGYTVALPIAGRLADTCAKRTIYLGALALFALSSIPAALASDLWTLVVARAVQAAGSGALVPVTLGYASGWFKGGGRMVALGLVVAAAEVGAVLGPFWGAVITQALSWRWIFLLNVPLAGLVAALVWRVPDEVPDRSFPLDWRSALLVALGMASLVTGLARDRTMPTALTVALVCVGLAALASFVMVQRYAANPLVDVRLFAGRVFASCNLTSLIIGAGLIVPMVNVPLFAGTVLERDALGGGLLLLRMMLLIPVGAVLGALLAARLGERTVVSVGAVLSGVGLWLAAGWTSDPAEVTLTRDLVVAGFGFGLVIAPLTASVIRVAGSSKAGAAAGLITVARLLGMMLALATLTPWALGRFNRAVAGISLPLGRGGESDAEMARLATVYGEGIANATTRMFSDLFLVGSLLCFVAVVPAFLIGSKPRASG